MPYQTIWETEGIRWFFSDYVSAEEIFQANEEFYEDRRSETARYQLIDTRAVTDVEWGGQDIVNVSTNDLGASRVNSSVKVAFVATEPRIWSKIEKYINVSRQLNSSWEFRGFDKIKKALTWIGGNKVQVSDLTNFQAI